MYAAPAMDRRTFIADLGRGAFALAIFAVAGCGPAGAGSPSPRAAGPTGSTGPTGGGASPTSTPADRDPGGPPGGLSWERVNLGFVSAYVLARAGEAALVDTGVEDSADAIESSLGAVGLGWEALGHVILTHHHADHVGSTAEVLRRAAAATAYAGAADIPSIPVGSLTAIGEGDEVFGLQVVASPGHTAGSISVLDPVAGVLVAGDALRTDANRPALPSPQFTVDMDLARQSIVKLGALSFETLLVGHGEPLVGGASALVAELGASG